MRPKLIITDAGDVLYYNPIKEVLRELDKFMGRNKVGHLRLKQGREWKRIGNKVREGKISHLEAERLVFEKIGAPELADAWMKVDNAFLIRNTKMIPGIKKTLENLKRKGYKLVVLSDAVHERSVLEKMYWKLGLMKYFDAIFWSNQIGFRKPQAEAYRKVIRHFGCSNAETIFVGHDIDEIQGANRIGIKTVLIGNKKVSHWKKIKSFNDLPKILRD